MTNKELIKEFDVRKKDLEAEMKNVNRDFERYYSVLGAMAELIELAEQLDETNEPKECEFITDNVYYSCSNCGFAELDCVELYREQVLDFNYCPNCGAKIKREVSNGK